MAASVIICVSCKQESLLHGLGMCKPCWCRQTRQDKKDKDVTAVYFMMDPKHKKRVKIGKANAVFSDRLQHARTFAPDMVVIAVQPADEEHLDQLEKAYHSDFAAQRLTGEWFTRTPELDAVIEGLQKRYGEQVAAAKKALDIE